MEQVLFDILLNSDIETIKNLCIINKSSFSYCNDKHFWQCKFKYDKMTIFGKNIITCKEWINEYICVDKSMYNTKLIIDINKIEFIKGRYIAYAIYLDYYPFDNHIDVRDFLPTKALTKMYKFFKDHDVDFDVTIYSISFKLKINNKYEISYHLDDSFYNECKMPCEYDVLYSILTIFLYHYEKGMGNVKKFRVSDDCDLPFLIADDNLTHSRSITRKRIIDDLHKKYTKIYQDLKNF